MKKSEKPIFAPVLLICWGSKSSVIFSSTHNLKSGEEIFNELIETTAGVLRIPAVFIEKDYWVTYILNRLSKSIYKETAIFKGGTSLSKAYKIIDRFSEDIDLAIITDCIDGIAVKRLSHLQIQIQPSN